MDALGLLSQHHRSERVLIVENQVTGTLLLIDSAFISYLTFNFRAEICNARYLLVVKF